MNGPLCAWRRCRLFDDVDPVAVDRACRGDRHVSLSRAEMAAAFHRLNDAGHSAADIADVLGVTRRTVLRWRTGETFPSSRAA